MPYLTDPHVIDTAFASGAASSGGEPVSFTVREIGRLRISTGLLSASDPLVNQTPLAFTRRVPPGEHPVTVAIAHSQGGDQRIAFARVQFGSGVPSRWELALTAGQDAALLGPDGFYGYPVDSGTGCFMDPVAGALLDERMRADDKYVVEVIDALQSTYVNTRSWADVRPNDSREENVVCFTSGVGDGSYPTFFGVDADGDVAVALTDFLLIWS